MFVTKLDPSFITPFKERKAPFGGVTGYVTYKRTYANRLDHDDPFSPIEDWWQTDQRCVEGIAEYGAFTKQELETIYAMVFNLKFNFSGRALWKAGTKAVKKIGADVLQNCWNVPVNSLKAFLFTMNELMLGGGVGFSVQAEHIFKLPKVKFKPTVKRVDESDVDFIVPDNREGWVELLERILEAFFVNGKDFTFSTHCLRAAGKPIKTFGGTASGGEALVRGMAEICKILANAYGRQLTSVDCLDIMNIIGMIVIAGNVRRSAEIALGDANDLKFLHAKKWTEGNVPNWRSNSNNSVVCNDIRELPDVFWDNYNGEGEPCGLVNLDNCRKYGRLIDGLNYRPDLRLTGVNPCGEIPLESYESCFVAGTRILTEFGFREIQTLVGESLNVYSGVSSEIELFKHGELNTATVFETGVKPVYQVETVDGKIVTCTAEHPFLAEVDGFRDWVPLSALSEGDSLVQANVLSDKNTANYSVDTKFYALGQFAGDGWFLENAGRIVAGFCGGGHEAKLINQLVDVWQDELFDEAKQFITSNYDNRYSRDLKIHTQANGVLNVSLTKPHVIKMLTDKYGFVPGKAPVKRFPSSYWKATTSEKLSFLRGLFDADGSVGETSRRTVNLSAANADFARDASLALSEFGISSRVNTVFVTDRNRFQSSLMIRGHDNLSNFLHHIYFEDNTFDSTKPAKLRAALAGVERIKQGSCLSIIKSISFVGEEVVYNLEVKCAKNYIAEGLVVHNCNLSEIYLPNLTGDHEFFLSAELVTKLTKTISTIKFIDPETQEAVDRNHRLGNSVTGILQAMHFRREGLFNKVYKHMEEVDRNYSKLLSVDPSVKLTTVKPSGTSSLLAGCTSGVHPDIAPFYIRRIQFGSGDQIPELCRKAGYRVEPKINIDGSYDYGTMVVEFPKKAPDGAVCADEISAVAQMDEAIWYQTHWADNSVSVTVVYDVEELPDIKTKLEKDYKDKIKTISFLLRAGASGFKQMPLEEIDESEYNEIVAGLKDIGEITTSGDMSSVECAGGSCPVR